MKKIQSSQKVSIHHKFYGNEDRYSIIIAGWIRLQQRQTSRFANSLLSKIIPNSLRKASFTTRVGRTLAPLHTSPFSSWLGSTYKQTIHVRNFLSVTRSCLNLSWKPHLKSGERERVKFDLNSHDPAWFSWDRWLQTCTFILWIHLQTH
jgi:hypothetical protein